MIYKVSNKNLNSVLSLHSSIVSELNWHLPLVLDIINANNSVVDN